MNNIHKCPSCKAVFEKIDGCSEMTCTQCYHCWCWVCGLNYNSNVHAFMVFPCQLINMTVLNSAIPKWVRFFMFLLYITIIPLLFLLVFCFCVPFVSFIDSRRYRGSGSYQVIDRIIMCRDGCCSISGFLLFILIAVPFWILFTVVCMIISIVATSILIIPFYIASVICLCRMVYWWNKNKRL